MIRSLNHSLLSNEIIKASFNNEILAKLLINRKIDTVEKINKFLNPININFIHPKNFNDMEKAILRVMKAIETHQRIVIYGDFDADGINSCALLYKTLLYLGADVIYYIPNRELESHGLNTKAIVKLISKEKVKLIITCDCGITDIDEVKFAKSFNVDTIITDHHAPIDKLPLAYAIINPKVENNLNEDLSFEDIESLNQLAGVGVAFKFAYALLEKYDKTQFSNDLLVFVSIGTIGDVVPLLNENRAFVSMGLKLIENGVHKGISKLFKSTGYNLDNGITSEMIAYGIVPRLNATGRIDSVEPAIKLLISDNDYELDLSVETLNNFNKIRQKISDDIYKEAIKKLEKENLKDNEAIILFDPSWHIGIIGIVASKLVEEFNRPVFLMTKEETTNLIRCSARGVKEINLHQLICEFQQYFEFYGGHYSACGLAFYESNISFNDLKFKLNSRINELTLDLNYVQNIFIDCELKLSDINIELVNLLKFLEPIGEKVDNPLFLLKNVNIKNLRTIGSNNNHIKFSVTKNEKDHIQESDITMDCIWWNHNKIEAKSSEKTDIVFSPKLNTFNGKTSIQLMIQDLKVQESIDKSLKNSTRLKEKEVILENIKNLDKKGNIFDFLLNKNIKIFDHRYKNNINLQVDNYIKNLNNQDKAFVFIENQEILNQIRNYKEIVKYIGNRNNILKANHLFLYDYPYSEELLNNLLINSQAKYLHLMKYDLNLSDIEIFFKNLSGMLRYGANYKNGKVSLDSLLVRLSSDIEVLKLALELFENVNMIKINLLYDNDLKYTFLNSVETSLIKSNDLYQQLQVLYEKHIEFRKELLHCQVAQHSRNINNHSELIKKN